MKETVVKEEDITEEEFTTTHILDQVYDGKRQSLVCVKNLLVQNSQD